MAPVRGAALSVLSLAGALLLPAAASAASTCAFDAATRTLSVDAPDEHSRTTIKRDGVRIVVRDAAGALACTGAAATVTGTDRIDVDAPGFASETTLDLAGGPLAPGFSAEPGGVPEIEIAIDGHTVGSQLHVKGTSAADTYRAGTRDGATQLNLNASETAPDADVSLVEADYLYIFSLGGADVVDGRGGAGTGEPIAQEWQVVAGSGNDTVHGGAGYTGLYGQDGNDRLEAGPATAPKEVALIAGAGDDTLVGGPADDVLVLGTGEDTVTGTTAGGKDHLRFDYDIRSGVRFDLQETGPQQTGHGIATVGPGIEYLTGVAEGDDVLLGTTGRERLDGSHGDDVLVSRGGDDVLAGGWGDDVADFSGAPGPVTAKLVEDAWGRPPAAGAGAILDAETVIGSPFGDHITGDDGENRIEGRGGADTLLGGNGYDTLLPGSGPDGGSDGGADKVDGGSGGDTVSYEDRKLPVAVRLDSTANDGADPDRDGFSTAEEEGDDVVGVETVIGGAGADRFRSVTSAGRWFFGGPGNDWLHGGTGNDRLDGQGGSDTVSYLGRVGRVAVRLDGQINDGADPDGDGFSEWDEEQDTLLSIENAVGGSGADTLVAAVPGVNALTGGPGADFLDALDGGTAVDRLLCGSGTDTFRADPGDARQDCETPGR